MDRVERNNNIYSHRKKLMKEILQVRYTDLNREKELCKSLLEISQAENEMYGYAFGNVYMFDCLLALGDNQKCDQYLIQGEFLCNKYGYDDLKLVLSNLAGLYYIKLNDELTAIKYYMEGLTIAEALGDYDTESKILNNIGFGFGGRGDWKTSLWYCERAFKVIEPYINGENYGNAISYLCNAAEGSKILGDLKTCLGLLQKCDTILKKGLYHKIRIGCGWCSYYSAKQDKESCIREMNHLLELGLLEYENKFFVADMLEALCNNLLDIDARDQTKQLLRILEQMEEETSPVNQYRIELTRIRYYKRYSEGELNAAYKRYYKLEKVLSAMDDETRAKNMLSKIQITGALSNLKKMHQENEILFNASQQDGLTGLYNRRYFNKLVSKVMQEQTVKFLGYIMIDVDYFKEYNDNYSHLEGDRALKRVAEILLKSAGDGIHVGRFGGDEFVCLCVNLSDEEVRGYAERVRKELRNRNIPHLFSRCSKQLTLSIGCSNEPFNGAPASDKLLALADDALYKTKENGRNGSYMLKLGDAGGP